MIGESVPPHAGWLKSWHPAPVTCDQSLMLCPGTLGAHVTVCDASDMDEHLSLHDCELAAMYQNELLVGGSLYSYCANGL